MSYPLVIGVMASMHDERYIRQIEGCLETWVKDAQQYNIPVVFFCGMNKSELQNDHASFVHFLIEDDYMSATHKQYFGLRNMYENYTADYYCILGSDNYINIDRTLDILKKYSPENKCAIGGYAQVRCMDRCITFFTGGGGIFISKEAMKILNPKIEFYITKWEEKCKKYGQFHLLPACDVSICDAFWFLDISLIIEKHFYPCSWRGYLKSPETLDFPIDRDQDKLLVHHYLEKEDLLFYHKYKKYAKEFISMEKQYRDLYEAPPFIFSSIYTKDNWELVLYFMIANNLLHPTERTLYLPEENFEISELGKKFDIKVKVYSGEEVGLAVNNNEVTSMLHVKI